MDAIKKFEGYDVHFSFSCSDYEGGSEINELVVFDLSGTEVDLDSLPLDLQRDIKESCQRYADDRAYDAYMDGIIGRADLLVDLELGK